MKWTSKKLRDLAREIKAFAERLHDLDPGEPYSYESWDFDDSEVEVVGSHYCLGDTDYAGTSAPLAWLVMHLNGEDWQALAAKRQMERQREKAESARRAEQETAAAQEIADRAQLDRLLKKYGKPLGPNEAAPEVES